MRQLLSNDIVGIHRRPRLNNRQDAIFQFVKIQMRHVNYINEDVFNDGDTDFYMYENAQKVRWLVSFNNSYILANCSLLKNYKLLLCVCPINVLCLFARV